MEYINPTGQFYEKKAPLDNKYGVLITIQDIKRNSQRLTNQLWKLIPMRENEEDWQKQLDTVTLEIAGLKEIFPDGAAILQLLSKLEGLRVTESSFELYRKTIFECISLLQGLS